jgi:8-oxo-dGTP pyrophosphatase MutT (NUDIX family)/phosphohistidine phosphatase SixA
MPDHQAAEEIRAAGAVLWRPAGRGIQVALIHRPKYDDWGLPKGKLESGEHRLLAAVREVSEETGLQVTLGPPLPPVRYLVDGQPKVVDYWAAGVPATAAAFTPNHEVDRLDWVALTQAWARLSYDHDIALLADFSAMPRPTVPLILVRHASAGAKSDWRKDDALRPLDSRGKQQARMLAALLRCFGSGRVLSSPAERCLATVRPFAAAIGATVEAVPEFGLPSGKLKKSDRAATAAELALTAAASATALAAGDQPVIVCAHRENMPVLLAASCAQLGAGEPAEPPLRKGGFLVLHRAAGRLAGAERHHPEDGRLPGRAGRRSGQPVQRRRQRALQDQQPALDLGPRAAAVAAETVTCQYAVAGHYHRDRVRAHDLSDCPGRRHLPGRRQPGRAG